MNAKPFKNVGWPGIAVAFISVLLVLPAKAGPMPQGFITPVIAFASIVMAWYGRLYRSVLNEIFAIAVAFMFLLMIVCFFVLIKRE